MPAPIQTIPATEADRGKASAAALNKMRNVGSNSRRFCIKIKWTKEYHVNTLGAVEEIFLVVRVRVKVLFGIIYTRTYTSLTT
jgi:hypothetical protein